MDTELRFRNLQILLAHFKTQERFASATGLASAHVSQLVHQRRRVADGVARRIEQALGLEARWLDQPEPSPPSHLGGPVEATGKPALINRIVAALMLPESKFPVATGVTVQSPFGPTPVDICAGNCMIDIRDFSVGSFDTEVNRLLSRRARLGRNARYGLVARMAEKSLRPQATSVMKQAISLKLLDAWLLTPISGEPALADIKRLCTQLS